MPLAIAVELAPKVTGDDSKRDTIARSDQFPISNEAEPAGFKNYAPSQASPRRASRTSAGGPEWFPAGVQSTYHHRRCDGCAFRIVETFDALRQSPQI